MNKLGPTVKGFGPAFAFKIKEERRERKIPPPSSQLCSRAERIRLRAVCLVLAQPVLNTRSICDPGRQAFRIPSG